MNIIQINEYCGTGSTGRICLELAKMMEKKGHNCKIIYGRKKATNESGEYGVRMTSSLGVYIHGAETRILDNHAFASTFETLRLLIFLKIYKPDLLHLHNLHGYYINVAVLFRYIITNKIPVIWTLHDCWPMTGHCSHFYHIGCNKWISGCHNCQQKKEYPASLVFDKSKKNWEKKKKIFTSLDCAVIVTPSIWLSELVNKSYLNKYQIKVVPNGIDLNVFYPRDDSMFSKKFGYKKIILGVSNVWTENKGIYDFINLVDMLDASKFQIVLVGEVKKDFEIPSNIYIIDRTDSTDELAKIYSSADIYVDLSKIEVLGTTIIEAMACGCPIVTYGAGGNSESIGEYGGRIIEKQNLSSVVDAIQQMAFLDKNVIRGACVQQAKIFSKEKMLENYYLLYKKLVNYE